ncbi:MAG: NADH:flavin oxidoreductase [Deltaproteobacteria bacterium]|nr:NADH:flavin oxidoreductase [Deltaproteobacteria bacterium]
MNILFESASIKNLEIKNRFVRSATADHASDEKGHITDTQIEIYKALGDGEIGLIITGITFVHVSGRISPHQVSIARDDCIPGLKKLTKAVHERGAKIAVQLFHAGRDALRSFEDRGFEPLAPSFVPGDPCFPYKGKYRAMTEDEIWEIVTAFGDAARRAREAGFDAVQVHGAHAYLFSQFLSPFTNLRQDQWGGDALEDRLRFHKEVYRDIRGKVGDDYPVLIKLGVQDGFPGGLTFQEGKRAARELAELGFDALEISHGLRGKGYGATEFQVNIDTIAKEAYFRDWTRQIKKEVTVPVMMVGGIRSYEVAEDIITKGDADLISMSRPLVREPNLIRDWMQGDRHRATCISCNGCLEEIRNNRPLRCTQKDS